MSPYQRNIVKSNSYFDKFGLISTLPLLFLKVRTLTCEADRLQYPLRTQPGVRLISNTMAEADWNGLTKTDKKYSSLPVDSLCPIVDLMRVLMISE